MLKISPSMTTADFAALGAAVQMVEKAGADWIHLDVMDGVFVPNLTFGPKMVKDIGGYTSLPLDVHLMVQDPRDYLAAYKEAGASVITIHAESPGCTHLHRVLRSIRDLGCKAGLSLNPATSPEVLEYAYEEADLILVMSVNPGFGGQKFIPSALRKVEHIANRLSKLGLSAEIEVDGGVNLNNCRSLEAAGATVLVAGSAVLNSPDPAAAIRGLKGI